MSNYYIVWCHDGTPKLSKFDNKIQMYEWIAEWAVTIGNDDGSWIDHIFHGELVKTSAGSIYDKNGEKVSE